MKERKETSAVCLNLSIKGQLSLSLCHTTSCVTLGFNFIFLENIKQKIAVSYENKEYCCNQDNVRTTLP